MSFKEFEAHMVQRGIQPEVFDMISRCGIDLDHWLEGFHDTDESVRKTVDTVLHHPLMAKDVVVRGFIIDSVTGELSEVK